MYTTCLDALKGMMDSVCSAQCLLTYVLNGKGEINLLTDKATFGYILKDDNMEVEIVAVEAKYGNLYIKYFDVQENAFVWKNVVENENIDNQFMNFQTIYNILHTLVFGGMNKVYAIE